MDCRLDPYILLFSGLPLAAYHPLGKTVFRLRYYAGLTNKFLILRAVFSPLFHYKSCIIKSENGPGNPE
jgi:hypothetical protein